MKPKTMILMGLAITCGLGASYMTSKLLAERTTPDEEKVTILVAKENLFVGKHLSKPEEFFEKKEVTKENEPPDSIKEFEALKGKILKTFRNKGEHVTEANLMSDRDGLRIPEGHKAIGLRVNLEGTASGFATLPQSRVNIIWTVRGQDLTSSFSQVLLENVLVLAADLKLTREGELASPAQVVTFALTDKELLQVTLAKELGNLSLALRNLDDKSKATDTLFNGKDLRQKKDEPVSTEPVKPEVVVVKPPEPAPMKPMAEPQPEVVRSYYDIVNGSDSGPREVTRVHYRELEDGGIMIERTEVIVAVPSAAPATAPGAAPKRQTQPRDF